MKKDNTPEGALVTLHPVISSGSITPLAEYKLQGVAIDPFAESQKEYLQNFLTENLDLLNTILENKDINEIEVFMSGYRQALSMVNLWIDSMNIMFPAPDPVHSSTSSESLEQDTSNKKA